MKKPNFCEEIISVCPNCECEVVLIRINNENIIYGPCNNCNTDCEESIWKFKNGGDKQKYRNVIKNFR